MTTRRKFVVVDTRGTALSSENPPCAIDRVRVLYDCYLPGGPDWSLGHWAATCTTGDVFKIDGLVYVCAVMWADDGPHQGDSYASTMSSVGMPTKNG
jgi:hypothetical protein